MNIVLGLLLAIAIGRLWLMPLSSSFWVDEMVTVFVIKHGPNHPSFSDAPQVPQSIYYFFAGIADRLFGVSETGYRIPSVIFMGIALYLIWRLAARLIHPQAGWFAVFACLTLRAFNFYARDARPYALGVAVLAASIWFLVRWLDSGRYWDAAAFLLCAASLLRVQMIFWPAYPALVFYAAVRVMRRESPVRLPLATGVFALLGLTLVPTVLASLPLLAEAHKHVVAGMPKPRDLGDSLRPALIVGSAAIALVFGPLIWRRKPAGAPERGTAFSVSSVCLIVAWWLFQPLGLYAFSHATGNSVFMARYLVIGLPGIALITTAAVGWFLPAQAWHRASLLLAIAVLAFMGRWDTLFPLHDEADWRSAGHSLQQTIGPDTPVVYPSPFVEARHPAWRPDYPLPGFLYAHLDVYPIPGKQYLLTMLPSPEATEYARQLSEHTLKDAGRFAILGQHESGLRWIKWFSDQPEFKGWSVRPIGNFGLVEARLFERAHPTTSR